MIFSSRTISQNNFQNWWVARLPSIRCRIFRIWRMRILSTAQSLQTAPTFAILVRFWILLILSICTVVFCLLRSFYIIKISGTRGAMLLGLSISSRDLEINLSRNRTSSHEFREIFNIFQLKRLYRLAITIYLLSSYALCYQSFALIESFESKISVISTSIDRLKETTKAKENTNEII